MSGAYALELRDLRKSFGKTEIIRGVNLAVTAGRARRHHRPQRRRQVDAVQPDQRPLRAHQRRHAAQRRAHQRQEALRDQPLGLSRSFQITNIFPKLSVFENLRCGVLWSLGYKYTFLKFLADLDDANERAEELMTMIKLDKKRDVLGMNLTYAEQRALEIGITIAGGASVILLDEPTAGMSRSETTRFISLIKEVTVGKTLLTVEHDMGVVFGLADKIAVVVYGEVIAFDTPGGGARQPAGAGGLPGLCRGRCPGRWRALTMLKIENLHAFYGKSHVLHGVDLRSGRARSSPCSGATARAAPPPPRPSWAWSHCDGSRALEGQGDPGPESLSRSPTWAWAMCPRAATSFPTLTVHQNLLLGQKGRRQGQPLVV